MDKKADGCGLDIAINSLIARPTTTVRRLECLWESSVRATHTFLSENNIQSLKPLVKQGLQTIPILCVASDSLNNILGFMGLAGNRIEMLFISPEAHRQGIGRRLLSHAIESFNAKLVDVNEQNLQAIAFYRHMGFIDCGRSPLDGQGNPFPLLHMTLEKNTLLHKNI